MLYRVAEFPELQTTAACSMLVAPRENPPDSFCIYFQEQKSIQVHACEMQNKHNYTIISDNNSRKHRLGIEFFPHNLLVQLNHSAWISILTDNCRCQIFEVNL